MTTNAIRTLPGGGWAIPARCDVVLSIMSPPGSELAEVRDALDVPDGVTVIHCDARQRDSAKNVLVALIEQVLLQRVA